MRIHVLGVQVSRGTTAAPVGMMPPGTAMRMNGMQPPTTAMRMPGGMAQPGAMMQMPGTAMRMGTAMQAMQQNDIGERPMTSIQGVGYSSDPSTRAGQQFDPFGQSQSRGPAPALQKKSESSTEEKLKVRGVTRRAYSCSTELSASPGHGEASERSD